MNILNIGTDKSLVGGARLGDAVERHKKYGEFLDHLAIIVYANRREGLKKFVISDKVVGYPSNSRSKLGFFFDAIKIAKKINQDQRLDLVQCQDPFMPALIGWWLKKTLGVKLQLNFHGDFWRNPAWLRERKINFLFWLISKFTVPRADAIRVMSAGQKEKLVQAGIEARKIRVISTPIDLNKFLNYEFSNNKVWRHGYEKLQGAKKVLNVGRDDKVKDYKTLAKAYKIIADKLFKSGKNSSLVLTQLGSAHEFLKCIKKENIKAPVVTGSGKLNQGINVEGIVEQSVLIDYYYFSDVVVLSSTSESFGKVLVEANACGKPVVSTATTGAKEIIQDRVNGFLVPVGDYQALAAKIIYLLEHPEQAREMGQKGREIVREKFGDNTAKIVQFWQDAINNQL